jgi:regulator of nucleoside diphosphate kinase
MEQQIAAASPAPPISVTREDHDRLADLAAAASDRLPEIADYLSAELARARIVEKAAPTLVTMGSRVSFRDEESGAVRAVTLVYPKDQDMEHGRLSVLTPVGSALLGLSAGQSIPWRTRDGRWKTLTVVDAANGAAAGAGA